MPNPPKSIGLLKKFVSTARSIITGQVGLPLGIMRLHKNFIGCRIHGIKPLSDDDLRIINSYYDLIKEYPIEQERLEWAPDVLQKLDENLERITKASEPKIMPILIRIVTEAT